MHDARRREVLVRVEQILRLIGILAGDVLQSAARERKRDGPGELAASLT